jgi:hypothetical protein
VSRRRTVARRGGAVVLTFLPAEVQVLQWIFGDLEQTLSGASGVDAVTQRLFPRAYLDPTAEESEGQWQEMVHDDLVETRLAALRDVAQTLDDAVVVPGRDEAREIVLAGDQPEHWMTVLNDARLAVGTALEVTPEWDFNALEPTDPNYQLHVVYAWMTELLSAILGVIAG